VLKSRTDAAADWIRRECAGVQAATAPSLGASSCSRASVHALDLTLWHADAATEPRTASLARALDALLAAAGTDT
jgi:hypothetical protein